MFDGVFGNPMASQANAGGAAFRAHSADCVIGFGGGAAVDVAKIVGVLGTAGGDALEYAWDHPQVRAIPDDAALLRRAADDVAAPARRSVARA